MFMRIVTFKSLILKLSVYFKSELDFKCNLRLSDTKVDLDIKLFIYWFLKTVLLMYKNEQ